MLASKTLSGSINRSLAPPKTAPSSRGSRAFGVQVPVVSRPVARRHAPSRTNAVGVQANLFSRFFRVIKVRNPPRLACSKL
eukprot:scaffold142580_cov17-Tisochrysis_lutea.AAC.1